LPLNTFIDDLSITIVDSNNLDHEFGNVILPVEYLPLEENL